MKRTNRRQNITSTNVDRTPRRTRNWWSSCSASFISTPGLIESSDMVRVRLRPLRELEKHRDHRPQRAADEAPDEIAIAREIRAREAANAEDDDVVQEEQRNDVHDLRSQGELAYAPVKHDAGVSEDGISERVLSEKSAV